MHRFMERDGIKWGLGLIVLALALRYCAAVGGVSNAREVAYYGIIGRIDQFVLGMIAARVYDQIKDRQLNWPLLSLAGFALALAVLVGYSVLGGWDSVELWKIAWPPCEGFAWACFIIAYVGFAQRHAGKWSLVIEHVGSWSYSIYLLHFPLLVAMPHLVPVLASDTPDQASQEYAWTVVIPVLLPLAALSYYVVERPFLQMRVKYLREA
jgi:peptidoglycan/LPS O-acetylase OafA/YrhL